MKQIQVQKKVRRSVAVDLDLRTPSGKPMAF